jgi:type III restriction enzyme
MKLKFDPNQQYQLDAVNAVVGIFDGQPLSGSDFEVSFTTAYGLLEFRELGIGNSLVLEDEKLLENVWKVQEKDEIEKAEALQGRHFSVEMETGTGKTYVYLRSIFELNKKYGFKKFVIVVPSVAIREGVLKNIDITRDHFLHLYNNVTFDYFVYDSKKVSQVRQFATSNQIQIMIINIDAFRKTLEDKDDEKKSNVIHRENDRLSGRKPIEFIQATHPIVIIDEPQSVDNTEKAKEAIETLNPLCTLRYSATHVNPYNLLYKLDPIKAYDMRLVKRIEVASVLGDANFNAAYLKLKGVDNKSGIKAKVAVHVKTAEGIKEKDLSVKQGDDLYIRSNERAEYKDGYVISEINCEPGNEYISFTSGRTLRLGEAQGGLNDDIMRVQIKNTIQEHLEKELRVNERGLKVLSLFFIDRVANYRYYDDNGQPCKGKIALWFEEFYQEFMKNPRYKALNSFDIEKVHDGYFSIDKKGQYKDTRGDTKDDEDVYAKIMKNKEQLLSLDEPLQYIFSHSALREGWDNPNVFQICTLNETRSELKKRQEIGRGLRLPVDQEGQRVFDETVNRLTVIANESYEDFAKTLQKEIEDDFKIKFGVVVKTAFAKVEILVDGAKKELGQDSSGQIWQELKVQGMIDENGKILPKFNPADKAFTLTMSPQFTEILPKVIDIVQGCRFTERIVNKNARRTLKLNKQVYLDEDFKKLWDQIKPKTTYSVQYKTADLVSKAVSAIQKMEKIEAVKINYHKAGLEISQKGIATKELRVQETTASYGKAKLPDILAYLQRETEITRATLVKILIDSGRLDEFFVNSQKFMDFVTRIIKRELHRLIIDGIKYEKIEGQEYEMRLFEQEEVIRYLNNLVDVGKSVYDAVEYDSDVERRFAQALDGREDIKLFVKLPDWFKVTTPLGTYNPDWAIVKHADQTLYLVRETKAFVDLAKLRMEEADKVQCGKKHFEELGVDFKLVSNAGEV